MISWRFTVLGGTLAALAGWMTIDVDRRVASAAAPESSEASMLPSAERAFSLVDQHGKPVSDVDFRGRWLIVYFGFTQCADVCPATLTVLAAALRMLGADADGLQPVFITIDPQHDTPKTLAPYLKNFAPNFIGLTGTATQIAAAAESFGAYEGRSGDGANAATSLAHSSSLYLVDPRGRLNRQFSSQMTAAQLATYLRRAVHSELPGGSQSQEGSRSDD
jgi:cytochrome oxidase Cu insertion factor (SCO1/SenC/PrrC family)